MNKTIYFFIFLLLACSNAFAQDTTNTLLWSPRRLQWEDFKAFPIKNGADRYHGVIYYGFGYHLFTEATAKFKNDVRLKLYAYYMPNQSQLNNTTDTREQTIRHEQIHFDMAEVYMRKLRRQLQDTVLPFKDWQRHIKRVTRQQWEALRRQQADFDADVWRDKGFVRLELWKNMMATQLQLLEAYNNPFITVKIKYETEAK